MSGALVPVPAAPVVPARSTPAETFARLYPYPADAADPRFVPETDRAEILALAVHFRPSCLADPVQDIAQAHYAAHLLSARAALVSGGGTTGTTTTTGATTGGEVIEWSEGNATIRYAPPTAAKTTTSSAIAAAKNAQPVNAYAAWKALADLCPAPGDVVTGGVLPSPTAAKARGYALLTGWD